MTREQAINYLKSSGMSEEQIKSVINAFTCEDCISREAVSKLLNDGWRKGIYPRDAIMALPSVTPKFTDAEIQKMQDLEQAQLEKAYELGKAEMQPCEDAISRLIVQEEISKSIALKENPHQLYKRIQAIPSVIPKSK